MASAKPITALIPQPPKEEVTGVTLSLTINEAEFLHNLLYRHCAGSGFYDPGYSKIGCAIAEAVPDIVDRSDRFGEDHTTLYFKKL